MKIQRETGLRLEIETCPHAHLEKRVAEECSGRAAQRIEKEGDWLDETSARRYVRLLRPAE